MSDANNLSNRMNSKFSKMSKGQKMLTNYISDNYDEAAFLTAMELGNKVGVSESTVVRYASFLGYKGFPQFSKAMGDMVKQELEKNENAETLSRRASEEKVFSTYFKNDIENLKETVRNIGNENFNNAVDMLDKANRIIVIGLQENALIAEHFANLLSKTGKDIRIISHSDIQKLVGTLQNINSEDCVFAVSLKPYSMKTLKALELSNDDNANIITLTDTLLSPVNLYSSCNLVVSSDMSQIMGSLTSACAMVQALFLALARKHEGEYLGRMERYEKLVDEYQFDNDNGMGFVE